MDGRAAAVAVDAVLSVLSLPVLGCAAYLAVLAMASRSVAPPRGSAPRTRFAFVVPAHDEEAGIAQTVASLFAVDYPRELFQVVVVADNCADATAALAEKAGALVLVRVDSEKRGKGYALAHAFDHLARQGSCEAVVVVDADTLVSPDLLRAFATRFEAGAVAVQADYGVRNPEASWRTRLMVIALALFHVLRSLGRERLGVSCGLRGNGMGFSIPLLREVPHDAFSIVEDLEYGIRLGLAGHRVEYVHEAHVFGEMVSGAKASRSQRTRWEKGRSVIAREHGLPLLRRAIAERSGLLLDLAMDVLVPPLTNLVALSVLGTSASLVSAWWAARLGVFGFAWIPWSSSLLFITAYVIRGVVLANVGWSGAAALAWAPFYMIWKIALAVTERRRKRKDEWVRTTREGKEARAPSSEP
jgi:cellulose synthase/poly-beta-1,6-N-acetylglucosamine synthase-like glycosyltransferase